MVVSAPSVDVETIVVGAGAVGLACAAKLAQMGREVMVLERHDLIGSETSARNSEVIHAGLYYEAGSRKAEYCVAGKRRLYDFCREHGVPFKRLGKLIVAANEGQLPLLAAIGEKARANGVDDVQLLDARSAAALEPELVGAGALFSPSTGILDSHAYMLALQGVLEANGGQVVLNTGVSGISRRSAGGFDVSVGADGFSVSCRELVVSAGLHATLVMETLEFTNGYRPPRTYFAKGSYFRLAGRAPFSHLIYPAPEPGGLGVHLTLDMGGQARFGPDVEWLAEETGPEAIDYRVDITRSQAFYAAVRQYWPGLQDGGLIADYSGVRPKLSRDGGAMDFCLHGVKTHGVDGLLALYGIESPGLTSSLALGEAVADLLRGA